MVKKNLYDSRGHRIPTKSPSLNGELVVLPPISNDASRQGSASSNGIKSAEIDDVNYRLSGEEIFGVLFAAILSRRKIDGPAGMTYLPELNANKPMSGTVGRGSRTVTGAQQAHDPYYQPPVYGRKVYDAPLVYEKNFGKERNQFTGQILKEFPQDMQITILDRPDKRGGSMSKRECHCLVSENRFRDLDGFVDAVSKVLIVQDRERYLHSEDKGTVMLAIGDLDDGGEYYFGDGGAQIETTTPDSITKSQVNEGGREKKETSSAGSRFSEKDGDGKYWQGGQGGPPGGRGELRKKKVTVVTNINGQNHGTFTFEVNEAKHRSIQELCQDLATNVNSGRFATVERVVLRNGKPLMSVGEIFLSPDDQLVAIVGDPAPGPYGHQGHQGHAGGWNDPYGYQGGYGGYGGGYRGGYMGQGGMHPGAAPAARGRRLSHLAPAGSMHPSYPY